MTLPVQHARCPSCGAPLDFALGSSRAAVCGFCKALVARKGQNFETVGKVADLIPTVTSLELGMSGTYEGKAFRLVGRLQYEWRQGVWDEWHMAFEDGRHAWLAEAQGRVDVLFLSLEAPLPALHGLTAGAHVRLGGAGAFTVTDLKEAKVVGARGELPDEIMLGDTHRTADLEGPGGQFATLDYGPRGDAAVALYLGLEVPLGNLRFQGVSAAPARGPEGAGLRCPNCHAPVTVQVPGQTVRLVCSSCNALLDVRQGALQLLAVLEKLRRGPRIPLNRTGKLRGQDVRVVGWMRRSCQVDGTFYTWEEYLLFEEASSTYAWLVLSEGHWSIARHISAAEVSPVADGMSHGNEYFRLFSRVLGVVDQVLGEFYWAVEVGERALLTDYIAPPMGLSLEKTKEEVNWSLLTHVSAKEVSAAFGLKELDSGRATHPGPIQPWPHLALWQRLMPMVGISEGVLFLLLAVFAATPQRVAFEKSDLSHMAAWQMAQVEDGGVDSLAPPPDRHALSYVSEPFGLQSRRNVHVSFHGDVRNSWAFAGAALIHTETGELTPVPLEASFYSGVADDGAWSEGSRTVGEDLGALPSGNYVLRADLQWDPALPTAPPMELRVVQGGVSFWQYLAAALALAWPLLLWSNRSSFEKARWEESTLAEQEGVFL